MKKNIFETPHNEIRCVISIKESNFNVKLGQNFHICLWSGPIFVYYKKMNSATLFFQIELTIEIFRQDMN